MKVTTYNQDGSINSEQELQIEIPDYIKKFVAAMGKSVHKYADIYKKIDWYAQPFWKGNNELAARTL